MSELGEDPTYASPTYPRFTVYIYIYIPDRRATKMFFMCFAASVKLLHPWEVATITEFADMLVEYRVVHSWNNAKLTKLTKRRRLRRKRKSPEAVQGGALKAVAKLPAVGPSSTSLLPALVTSQDGLRMYWMVRPAYLSHSFQLHVPMQ